MPVPRQQPTASQSTSATYPVSALYTPHPAPLHEQQYNRPPVSITATAPTADSDSLLRGQHTAGMSRRAWNGVPLNWSAGSIFKTFPWQILEGSLGELGFHLETFQKKGQELWVRSNSCSGQVLGDQSAACERCQCVSISRLVIQAQARADQIDTECTAYKWLTYEPMI